ncbi:MAG: hypothetical protein R3B49_05980 [Phycisphaerales bacterium]
MLDNFNADHVRWHRQGQGRRAPRRYRATSSATWPLPLITMRSCRSSPDASPVIVIEKIFHPVAWLAALEAI